MEITPPIASEPYSPLCGPRKTSIRAMSPVNSWPKSNDSLGLLGSDTSMPSIRTLTSLELVPRMKTDVWPPGPPVWTTFRPGTAANASGTVRCCWLAMSAPVMTVDRTRGLLARCGKGRRTDDDRIAGRLVRWLRRRRRGDRNYRQLDRLSGRRLLRILRKSRNPRRKQKRGNDNAHEETTGAADAAPHSGELGNMETPRVTRPVARHRELVSRTSEQG